MRNLQFAVVDFETTGLSPARDRVVELAVVHLDGAGEVTGRWETLLNPGRDLGPQRIHGIRAADVLGAPTFEAIAGQFLELLRGRAFVAHNATFDAGFLYEELRRSGVEASFDPEAALCTMQLAGEFLGGARRSLAACCAAYGIEIGQAHRAAADALATARLLAAYLRRRPDPAWWRDRVAAAQRIRWPALPAASVEWVRRRDGLRRRRSAPQAPSTLELRRGDRVVLTGDMRRPREAWHRLLRARGFEPWPYVTKQVKVVGAADPDSLSSKARKAREYGIPIVDEAGLEALLGGVRRGG